MIVSITHNDLDGLGSQAIVRRFFCAFNKVAPTDFKGYFAHYGTFLKIVDTALSTSEIPEQLVITDLGFNDDFGQVFPKLKKIMKSGCKVSWFDHHVIDESVRKELERTITVYRNDEQWCGAELVKDYYLPDDEVAKQIAEYARDIDFDTKKYPVATDLQSVIAYNKKDEDVDNKRTIVRLLSEGSFQDEWFDQQLKKLRSWEEEQTKFALNHAQSFEIKNLGTLVVSFASIGGSKITRVLEKKFPTAKVYLGLDKRSDEIIVHSRFINCREFCREFGGGGHLDRAGFILKGVLDRENRFNPAFLEKGKKTALKYKL